MDSLVGKRCAVAKKNGRGRWWVEIIEEHPSRKYVRVSGGKMFGESRWVAVADCMELKLKT